MFFFSFTVKSTICEKSLSSIFIISRVVRSASSSTARSSTLFFEKSVCVSINIKRTGTLWGQLTNLWLSSVFEVMYKDNDMSCHRKQSYSLFCKSTAEQKSYRCCHLVSLEFHEERWELSFFRDWIHLGQRKTIHYEGAQTNRYLLFQCQ